MQCALLPWIYIMKRFEFAVAYYDGISSVFLG